MKFTRGNTFKPTGNPAKRPPKLKGRVANDLWPNPARSAAGPPPTKDTQGAERHGAVPQRRQEGDPQGRTGRENRVVAGVWEVDLRVTAAAAGAGRSDQSGL